MTIDRSRWEGTLHQLPGWLCPLCEKGHLRLMKDTLAMNDTAESRRARGNPGWEHDWVEKRFSALLRCDHASCREVAAVAGTTSVTESSEEIDGVEQQVFVDGFNVVAIQPAPLPFPLGPNIPSYVCAAIRTAAALYWMDREAAANKLRQSVEVLPTEQGIRRTTIFKRQKRELRLHNRIVEYQAKRPDAAELLLAVKWLGNEGSHPGAVSAEGPP
jgi:hypothetical protein